jgi:hypothetical protein
VLGIGGAACAGDPGRSYPSSKGQGPFEFALIGDVPYGVGPGEDYPPFTDLTADVNASPRIHWVLHAGDIKAGSADCSDTWFEDRLYRYNLFNKPFVLTLGDNEWTDCHRVAAGEYQPLERLARLREIFYPTPGETIGGITMRVDTQADVAGFDEFPENVRWVKHRIVFATLHLVGSQNGLAPFDANSSAVRTPADDAEVERRTEAAISWLNEAFDLAEDTDSPGIFLMIHANPGLERTLAGVDRTGFKAFLAELEQRAVLFGKPVVLAHGDSHYFRVDKPRLVDTRFLPNFTRIETFGASRVHWIRVTVDPESPEVFGFEQEIVGDES